MKKKNLKKKKKLTEYTHTIQADKHSLHFMVQKRQIKDK